MRDFLPRDTKFAARPCGELSQRRATGLPQMQAFLGNFGGVSDGFPPRPVSRANPSPFAAMCLTDTAGPYGEHLRLMTAPWPIGPASPFDKPDRHFREIGYCVGSGIRGRTVTLKVIVREFQQITRSRTGQMQITTRSELEQLGNALLEPLSPVERGVRLLGVSLSSLAEESEREPEFSLPV